MTLINYFKNLHLNIRFYILVFSVALSLVILATLRLTVPSDQLFLIRLQQVYGLVAVLFLYLAIILTPISKITKGRTVLPVLLFSRRAFGVSAAYFAVLHTVITLSDQVGGIGNLSLLPQRFIVAFALGVIALIILLLMAVTSFDAAIKRLTFKRWKQLHQFVYIAGVLIIIHIWLIGTHSDSGGIRVAGAAALAVLFALEANRVAVWLSQKYQLSKTQRLLSTAITFTALSASLLLLPLIGGNYHTDHLEDYNSTTESAR